MLDTILFMFARGYAVAMGEHSPDLTGYWACFYKVGKDRECDDCGETICHWEHCGHAVSLPEAIEMARSLVLNPCAELKVPHSVEFGRKR